MTNLSREKKAGWQRPVIGGLLSAVISGLTISVFFLMPHVVSGFFGIVFLTPAYIVESAVARGASSFRLEDWLSIFISILFWVVAGALIARSFEKKKTAISCWLLLYLSLILIGFGIFFLRYVL